MYSLLERVEVVMNLDSQVSINKIKNGYCFELESVEIVEFNIIFYLGGLVELISYVLFVRKLVEEGYRVYIVDMFLNLVMFGENKVDFFIEEYLDEVFVIGGYLLGGVFVLWYVVQYIDMLEGVFYLVFYVDESGSLKEMDLFVLQIIGIDDGVLNFE